MDCHTLERSDIYKCFWRTALNRLEIILESPITENDKLKYLKHLKEHAYLLHAFTIIHFE